MVISEKLQAYIAEIEDLTNRKVKLRANNNLGLSGMKACFLEDPTYLLVEVSASIDPITFEHSIAHETTHGLISYGKKYPALNPIGLLSETERHSIELVVTMVEDIIVNKIIFEKGFPPFPPTYLQEVQAEIKAANKNRDHYIEFQDPIFKFRFMVFRYIQAWGFLNFFNLDTETLTLLNRFEKAFRYSFTGPYKEASSVKGVIEKGNIFCVEGYCQVVRDILTIWKLSHLVNFANE